MNDLSESLDRLISRIDLLERRVSALEQSHSNVPSSTLPAQPVATVQAAPLPQDSGILSILGKAMLAIAGAYFLRALAESSALPRVPLIVISIAYAFFWLMPAARAKARLPSIAWAVTSVIILVPMLWELTLRFRLLPDSAAAVVLAGFMIAASALGWNRRFTEISWVADSAAGLTAVALAFAARDITPFLAALLVPAIAGEIAAARYRTLRVRPLVAAAADFLTFALIWIYSTPVASRPEYPPVNAALLLAAPPLLLFLYAGSASAQTLLLGRRISFFETAQTLIAFLLTVWGLLVFWSGPAQRWLGILCLAASAAGYTFAFAGFDRASSRRNFHVYAAGSAMLMLAGCRMSLPWPWLPLTLTALAVAVTLIGTLRASRTLEFHGLLFLYAAALSSGLFAWAIHSLAGRFPAPPVWILYLVSGAAILGFAAGVVSRGDGWPLLILRLLRAALALSAAASLLVWGLAGVIVGTAPPPEHLALLRTLAGCSLTVLLAFAGSRGRLRELIWLAWTSLACIAAKLLFEDLRHGRLAFTAASIFLYAVTLLAVPRLLRVPDHARPSVKNGL